MGGRGPRVSWLQGRGKSPLSSGPQGQAAFGHDLKGLMPLDTCCPSLDTLPGSAWWAVGCHQEWGGNLKKEGKGQRRGRIPESHPILGSTSEAGRRVESSALCPLLWPRSLAQLQASKAASHSRVSPQLNSSSWASLSPSGCD